MPLMPISEGRVNKAASTNISERSSEMMPCDQSVTYSGIEAGDKDIEARKIKQ